VRVVDESEFGHIAGSKLLLSLSEQLKTPLVQIAHTADYAAVMKDFSASPLQTVGALARSSLLLIDSFMLSSQLATGQLALAFEPVSVSAVMDDVAHSLYPLAKTYDMSLQIDIAGKYGPVVANRKILEAALASLGHAFVVAHTEQGLTTQLRFSAHKNGKDIRVGLFSETAQALTAELYQKGRELHGRARQPLATFSASAGAGIFIADSLLSSMNSDLKIARHQKQTGLAVTMPLNRQLRLV
jgi:K+-sensing histidine kinase KdpD